MGPHVHPALAIPGSPAIYSPIATGTGTKAPTLTELRGTTLPVLWLRGSDGVNLVRWPAAGGRDRLRTRLGRQYDQGPRAGTYSTQAGDGRGVDDRASAAVASS